MRISKFRNKLTKLEFRDNMGILGLDTAFHLSDRIFNVMDENGDESVYL